VKFLCLPGDYTGSLLFCFENGKAARVELSAYQTVTRRRRLTGAYSDRSPLVAAMHLKEDMEVAFRSNGDRLLLFHTSALAPKTTRTTQGVFVMTLKSKQHLAEAKPLQQTAVANPGRYRVRSLPAAGALLRPEDRGEHQLELFPETETET
jgi:DNA gyrase subunit A